MRQINDLAFYKKIHATLPAASLGATKARIRSGEAKTIEDLWNKKDKTFLAIDFEWSERNPATCLEWGYAALRAGPVASWAFLWLYSGLQLIFTSGPEHGLLTRILIIGIPFCPLTSIPLTLFQGRDTMLYPNMLILL